jgi:hypothetical protein
MPEPGLSHLASKALVKHWKISRLLTAPTARRFQLSDYLHRLTENIAVKCPELRHIDPKQMLFTITPARKNSMYGLQARVTPLRFKNGELTQKRRGKTYHVQRYVVDGCEILYLVTFCVPRFLDQSFREKLITIFHELYHINPSFDGDLRRHESRYEYHTHSKEEYDELMGQLVDRYIATKPDPELLAPLALSSSGFREQYGRVMAFKIPQPKMIPI